MKEDKKAFVLAAIKSGRYTCDEEGNIYGPCSAKSSRPLSNRPTPAGYIMVGISHLGKMRAAYAHTVVFMYFRGKIPKSMEINHKNGIKNDNRISNLEAVTSSENAKHARRTGLVVPVRGEAHGSSKLTEKDVIDIRYLLYLGRECGFPNSKIAKIYGVNEMSIHDIAKKITWTHI